MSTALVVSLNQAAIDGIRAAGAKQVINVEGNGKRWIRPVITVELPARRRCRTNLSVRWLTLHSLDRCLDLDNVQRH